MKTPTSLIEVTVRKYVEKHRPPEHIRPKLDKGYTIDGQKIYINEIRPDWRNPEIIRHRPYAKIWHIKSGKIYLQAVLDAGEWELGALRSVSGIHSSPGITGRCAR